MPEDDDELNSYLKAKLKDLEEAGFEIREIRRTKRSYIIKLQMGPLTFETQITDPRMGKDGVKQSMYSRTPSRKKDDDE
ncbi:MAG: hypothetical protein ACTSUJ_08895 [Candidatus Njordarchaeales archaeon]